MKQKTGLFLVSTPALAACLLLAAPAFSASYYVDQANSVASDSNPGTEALPWKTLYRAEKQALQPGDIVNVKAGTYDASVGGNWAEPAINPPASGTQGNPITFRSVPRHAAILKGGTAAPAIGTYGRSYIVIDGFVVTTNSTHGINVVGGSAGSRVKGNVVQNTIIHGMRNTHPTDNTDGILIQYASGTHIRNNKIYDIHNGTDSWNAAGIKLYTTDNTLVENNEFYGMPTGVYDKSTGTNNTYRRNYFHDLSIVGILFTTQNGNLSTGHRIYENIFNKCNSNVNNNSPEFASTVDKVWVYNNVFANYGPEGGIRPSKYAGSMYIYNNIFYRANPPQFGEMWTSNDPPSTVALMDYNLYPTNPKWVIGRYVTNRSFTSLPSWQGATSFDRHSATGDPGFVNAAAGDFRLAPGSMAVSTGLSGGVAGGTPVNMGAYTRGDEVIGLLKDTNVPKAPVLIKVN